MARSKEGRATRTVGSSTYPVTVTGSANHNFEEVVYKSVVPTGYDVRGKYEDLYFDSTGGGEMLRLRGIANGTLCATGGTINALHATGRVASGKTVSGALNAVRATLEVAGTTPTPGGTLAALQLDSNIVTGATMGANDAFVRVTDSGATALTNLLNVTQTAGDKSATALYSTVKTAATNWSHGIKIRLNGTTAWLMATTTSPAA
jgi:hypothetical protein